MASVGCELTADDRDRLRTPYARIDYETNFTFYQDPPEILEDQEVGKMRYK